MYHQIWALTHTVSFFTLDVQLMQREWWVSSHWPLEGGCPYEKFNICGHWGRSRLLQGCQSSCTYIWMDAICNCLSIFRDLYKNIEYWILMFESGFFSCTNLHLWFVANSAIWNAGSQQRVCKDFKWKFCMWLIIFGCDHDLGSRDTIMKSISAYSLLL